MMMARVSVQLLLLLPLLLLVAPSAEAEKPGVCPVLPPDSVGTCDEACMDDESCPKEQKCCSNGCGHYCAQPQELHPVDPLKPKAGFCPYVDTRLIKCAYHPDLDKCHQDWECKGEEKCCSIGCSKICQKPVKPGSCPVLMSKIFCIRYENGCSSDSDCDGKKKCCSVPCGVGCVDPVKVKDSTEDSKESSQSGLSESSKEDSDENK